MRTLGVISCALVLVAVAAGASRASFPGSNGKIFFTAGGHVYSVDPDGSGLVQVTSSAGNDYSLGVAAGGNSVVFARDTSEQCGHTNWNQGVDLFSVSADGTHETRLTNNCPVGETNPSFSPSGGHIVFVRGNELWSMRTDGSDLAKLTCDSSDYSPAWSPDGRLIVFERYGAISVMDANGDHVHALTAGFSGYDPSFSPDGTKLAYAGGSTNGTPGIHVVSLDGSGDHRLTTGSDGAPAWSPDGSQIAFNRGGTALLAMNADGTNVRTVTNASNVGDLDWATTATAQATEPNVTAADTACAESSPPPPVQPTPPEPAPVAAPVQPLALRIATVSFTPRILRTRKPFVLKLVVRDNVAAAVPGATVKVNSPDGQVLAATGKTAGSGAALVVVRPTARLHGGRLVLIARASKPSETPAQRLISIRRG
jgi:TolB protein